jgi:DNA-binding transcriptional LysR family regulator
VELRQVRYFLALARSLNFTRAAEQCNVTQPALTRAIKKLEEELGGPLVHRERRRTQLTELGKLLLPMLEQTAFAVAATRRCAVEFQQKAIAPLAIGLTPCVSANLIIDTVSEVASQVPGLRVELIEVPSTDLASMLLDGVINVALSGDDNDLPPRIDRWQLFEEPFVILAAANSGFAAIDRIPMDLLSDATWLERIGCVATGRFWRSRYSEDRPPKIAHRGRQESHLQHLVAAGLGLMLAPEHAPRLPTVIARPIWGDPICRTVSLLAVSGRRYSPALDAFVRVARQRSWKAPIIPPDAPDGHALPTRSDGRSTGAADPAVQRPGS